MENRTHLRRRFVVRILMVVVSLVIGANVNSEIVGNFRLVGLHGLGYELYYYKDSSAIVLVAYDDACLETGGLLEIMTNPPWDTLDHRDVQVFVIATGAVATAHSNLQRHVVLGPLAENFTVLWDEAHSVSKMLGFTDVGEFAIIDPSTWRRVYGGKLHRLRDAGHLLATGMNLESAAFEEHKDTDEPDGGDCRLRLRSLSHVDSDTMYSNHVGSVLLEKCVVCHRRGGIGPWVMDRYLTVYGFAPMIAEVVRTKRMPPWHVDPAFGKFSHVGGLSTDQESMVLEWVSRGAPRGTGDDPLQLHVDYQDEMSWTLGEPDVVVDLPMVSIPASGVLPYKYVRAVVPLEREAWLRGAELLPGDPRAVHHSLVFAADGVSRDPLAGRYLFSYAPGRSAAFFPEDTGKRLRGRTTLSIQMHYTPFGQVTTDASKIGLYFHDDMPRHSLHDVILMNRDIEIPAFAEAHSDSQRLLVRKPMIVYSLLPHAHYRGKAARFELVRSNGSHETLLSIPHYDFNWQFEYHLAEPVFLPVGSELIYTNTWDNSAYNVSNPDANAIVRWGLQSWDEMLFGVITYRQADASESSASVVH